TRFAESVLSRVGKDDLASLLAEASASMSALSTRPELIEQLTGPDEVVPSVRLLFDCEQLTAFAITSAPCYVSEIHDHGCWGGVGRVAGNELETVHRRLPAGDGRFRLEVVETRRMSPGTVSIITPPSRDVHRVATVGTVPSVTLHAFALDIVRRG